VPDRRNRIDWDTLRRRIRNGSLIPLIGDRVGHDGFLTSNELIQAWASKVEYPILETRSLTRVAQFHSVFKDPPTAKEDYLEFLKSYLLEKIRAQGATSSEFLDTLEAELEKLSFSQVAARLKYPKFDDESMNPLRILAQLDIPIYITTSFHHFMVQALEKANKSPRVEVCPWEPWNPGGVLATPGGNDYEDDPQRPIVYHLLGIDSHAPSLVLTEDDYLDFLVSITQKGTRSDTQHSNVLLDRIRQAMSTSTLLLLGYELQDWDFRVLLRGLIKERNARTKLKSICIQIDPEHADEEAVSQLESYLQAYFNQYQFDIYWGNIETFTQELWEQVGA
jgi:hypothetical protein